MKVEKYEELLNLENSLNNLACELESIGNELSKSLKPDLMKDNHFCCIHFFNRQLSLLRSINLLSCDSRILIARSMFEGGIYLCLCLKNEEKMESFRLYSLKRDIERFKSGEEPPELVKKELEGYLRRFEDLFYDKGKLVRNWYGNKSIKQLANDLGGYFMMLYNEYYVYMSEYHHWSPQSFVKRQTCKNGVIENTKNEEVALENVKVLTMAISCACNTFKNAVKIINREQPELLLQFERKYNEIEGLHTQEVKFNEKNR